MKHSNILFFILLFISNSCTEQGHESAVRIDTQLAAIITDYIKACEPNKDKIAVTIKYSGCSNRKVFYIENTTENPYINKKYPSEYALIGNYMVLFYNEASPYIGKPEIKAVNDYSLKYLKNSNDYTRLYDPLVWKVVICDKSMSVNKGYIFSNSDCFRCK
ncbi:hypothetical protein [Hymenobacter rubripertinctus]|uniref:hypothetical protein n=1 Tax=Hymenobacter rubripertinctus TaxID=2029981 RepID=UPI0011C40A24|nr:hypothetical protein [Hymenobacter rubripertinctus]